MNAIRVRKKLDSETLNLPELRPLLGRTVEIIVLAEEPIPGIRPGAGNWEAALTAVEELEDYDFDAVTRQREHDLKHAKDHLPSSWLMPEY
ncbi:MAG TPA: hypothetical protein VMF69_18270 [Gemmataceae bacterium]|nr:hypothetical protein [Gemmataceae bacterium]